jgi:nitrogen regulatory protein PII-like uncharacterized protein
MTVLVERCENGFLVMSYSSICASKIERLVIEEYADGVYVNAVSDTFTYTLAKGKSKEEAKEDMRTLLKMINDTRQSEITINIVKKEKVNERMMNVEIE